MYVFVCMYVRTYECVRTYVCITLYHALSNFFLFGVTAPSGPGAPHSRGFEIQLNDAPQLVGLLWTSD